MDSHSVTMQVHFDRLAQSLPAYKMCCALEGERRAKVLVLAEPLLKQSYQDDFNHIPSQLRQLEKHGDAVQNIARLAGF